MYESDIHSTTNGLGISVAGLSKQFGEVYALRNISFEVRQGTVLGLLGHNGAGKTTTLRILTTFTQPTGGSAQVAGFDVVQQASKVRQEIGVVGQYPTVDGVLTARENLQMIARLHHLPARTATRCADELLERVGLASHASRLVKTFSGGMKRRVDLAASLISNPAVLFLDEPTTGLDPGSRNELWEIIRERVRNGTTVVLTTQYLEEADCVADSIVVLDNGIVAASGTSSELKREIGGEWVAVTVGDCSSLEYAADAMSPFAQGAVSYHHDRLEVTAPVMEHTRLIDLVRSLDAAGVDVIDIRRREATLDDVFLTLTKKQPHQKVPA